MIFVVENNNTNKDTKENKNKYQPHKHHITHAYTHKVKLLSMGVINVISVSIIYMS